MRIALAKLFLRRPDLLLLDEPPTTWTSKASSGCAASSPATRAPCSSFPTTRAFMDACVDHVAALENRRVTTYTGNYSSYLKQREDNLEQMRAKRAAQEREIAHMQVFVDKFRYKPTKAAQAQERMKKIEQIKSELVILPEGHKHVDFKFPDPPRSGDQVIALEHVSKRYEDKQVYDDIDLKLYRGDHVALVGPQRRRQVHAAQDDRGCRETHIGLGRPRPARGRGLLRQHQLEGMKESNTVLQEIDSVAPHVDRPAATQPARRLSVSPAKTSTSA